ncbi:hypothetical protein INR49_006732 [Caranx melampygus]|nr:hypothetical protein INR49_006732 [Caranx melampygus]
MKKSPTHQRSWSSERPQELTGDHRNIQLLLLLLLLPPPHTVTLRLLHLIQTNMDAVNKQQQSVAQFVRHKATCW